MFLRLSLCLLWRNVYLDLPSIFWLGCFDFFFFNIDLHERLDILVINPLSIASFENYFLPFYGLSFCFVYGFLCCGKPLSLIKTSGFCFYFFLL